MANTSTYQVTEEGQHNSLAQPTGMEAAGLRVQVDLGNQLFRSTHEPDAQPWRRFHSVVSNVWTYNAGLHNSGAHQGTGSWTWSRNVARAHLRRWRRSWGRGRHETEPRACQVANTTQCLHRRWLCSHATTYLQEVVRVILQNQHIVATADVVGLTTALCAHGTTGRVGTCGNSVQHLRVACAYDGVSDWHMGDTMKLAPTRTRGLRPSVHVSRILASSLVHKPSPSTGTPTRRAPLLFKAARAPVYVGDSTSRLSPSSSSTSKALASASCSNGAYNTRQGQHRWP